MQLPIWLKVLAKSLLLPPGGPLLVALLGLLLWTSRPRLARICVGLGLVTLLALSMPVVSNLGAWCFSERAPFDFSRTTDAQAIVILGGGKKPLAPEYGGETPNRLSMERLRYGALVARKTQLPVLLSGGVIGPGATEAALMRDALQQEFGVPARWLETRSTDTHENATFSAAMLADDGVRSAIVVAHAFDMPRALAEFRAAGLRVTPAPVDLPHHPLTLRATDFLPSVAALESSHYLLYEMLAYAKSGLLF